MAVFQSTFLYTLTPGGTGQYTVNGQIADAGASADGTDDVISVSESVPVTFTDPDNADLNGDYTYLGHEPGIPGYVAEGPDGLFYLFSNEEVPLNQNFNIQAEDIPVCFLGGTMIACPGAERPVESLEVGDLVLTADGRAVPVRWLGRQTIFAGFGLNLRSLPVQVAAGALGENLPVRDLRLTADHALLIDGVLVHAGALVNGTTIRRIPLGELGNRFVVYHVETEDHEIILAEGAPAETFIDNVTRQHFDNYAEFEALFGVAPAAMQELPQPRAMSFRQVPQAIRARIAKAAVALLPANEAAA